MRFVIWALASIYVFLAGAVVVGIVVDPLAFIPGPAGESGAGWFFACAAVMLLISISWPLALAANSRWETMDGYDEEAQPH